MLILNTVQTNTQTRNKFDDVPQDSTIVLFPTLDQSSGELASHIPPDRGKGRHTTVYQQERFPTLLQGAVCCGLFQVGRVLGTPGVASRALGDRP